MAKTAFNANEMSSFDIERIKRQRNSITSTKNTSTQRTISSSKNIDIEEKRRRILFANEKDFVFENTGFLTEYSSAMKQRILDSDYVCLSFRATADAPSSRPLAIGNATEIGPGCDWRRYRQLAQVAGSNAEVDSATRLRVWVVGTAYGVMVWDLDALDRFAIHALISDSINFNRVYCYNAAELLTWAMHAAGTRDLEPGEIYDPLLHVRYQDPARLYDASMAAVYDDVAANAIRSHGKASPPASMLALMRGTGHQYDLAGAGDWHGRIWCVAPLSQWHYTSAVRGAMNAMDLMPGDKVLGSMLPVNLARLGANGIPVDADVLAEIRGGAAAGVATASDAVIGHIPTLAPMRSRISTLSGGANDDIRRAIGSYVAGAGIELDTGDSGVPLISQKALSKNGAISLPGVVAWRDLCDTRRNLAACDEMLASVGSDGRVHPVFGYDTATGRLTAKKPAAMAMDRRLRSAVVAPAGHVIISADYSQIELRIAACYAEKMRDGAGQPGMLATALRNGIDPHLVTATQTIQMRGDLSFDGNAAAFITGMADDVRTQLREQFSIERDTAKAQNFGLLYGMSDEAFWEYGRLAFGLVWTIDEAAAARAAWFSMYPEIGQLHDDHRRMFNDAPREEIFTRMYDGTFAVAGARIVSGSTLSGRTVVATNPLQLLNYECQGSGADIIIDAIDGMNPSVLRHLINVVHDELVLCVPECDADDAAAEVQRAMLAAEESVFAAYGIPASVDVTTGKHWL